MRNWRPGLIRRVGLLILLGLGAWALYAFVDDEAVRRLEEGRHFWRNMPWLMALRQFGRSTAPMWLIAVFAWLRKRPRFVVAGLVALLLMATSVSVVKFAVQRSRPGKADVQLIPALAEGKIPNYGFPSGDTCSAFALAAVAAEMLGPYGAAFVYILAAAVGVLRVLMWHHYPSDVCAGALIGLACGWAALPLARTLCCRAPPWLCASGRPHWIGAGILLLPIVMTLCEVVDGHFAFISFLGVFAPFAAAVLLLARGRLFLRWLARRRFGRASSAPQRAAATSVLIIGLSALTVLPSLSWTTLYHRDEGYYVGGAAEMMEGGNVFVPHFSGEPWLEKPPLAYWAMALSMKLLGRTEFAARLPNALAALAAVFLVFRLASHMYSPLAGAAASLMLMTSLLFAGAARVALLDGFLVCSALLAMTGFWEFLRTGGNRGLFLFYLGCGISL